MARLTDRPDMTLDVYRGRKTTMQQLCGPCMAAIGGYYYFSFFKLLFICLNLPVFCICIY